MRHAYSAAALVAALLCTAAVPATQPDASAYPALQHLLAKLQLDVRDLQGQNASLVHDNAALREQVAALQPKPKVRPAHVPDDGQPHLDAIAVGMTVDDVFDLAGTGNVLASKRAATSTLYLVYAWSVPAFDNGNGLTRSIWGSLTVDRNGRVTHVRHTGGAEN